MPPESTIAGTPELTTAGTREPVTAGAASLPVDVFLECLRAADLPTRVRFSHVSRTWRKIAIGNGRLWDSFSCRYFRDQREQDVMFDMLKAMLRRSGSLPFRLRIPHHYCGTSAPLYGDDLCALDSETSSLDSETDSLSSETDSEYAVRLLSLEGLDVLRLALYDGPLDIFCRLNPHSTPLPALVSLNIFGLNDPYSLREHRRMKERFSARSLPNLEEFTARRLPFSIDSEPLLALKHLTCTLFPGTDYQLLFECYPNLVELCLVCASDTTLTPILPPRSLKKIVLRSELYKQVNIPETLQNWADQCLPRVVLQGFHPLNRVLPLFLAGDEHAELELRLTSRNRELELVSRTDDDAIPARTWTVAPGVELDMDVNLLCTLETGGCERLTSLSVAIEQVWRLFSAQLDFPGLAHLQFRLIGRQEQPLHDVDDYGLFLRAPLLQHVALNFDGTVRADKGEIDLLFGDPHRQQIFLNFYNVDFDGTVPADKGEIYNLLGMLCSHFRILLRYDAALLESVTACVPKDCALEVDCSDFAHFAKEYVICVTL